MRRDERVDTNSLSYIRGRYGPDSLEYKEARERVYGKPKQFKFVPKPRAHELEDAIEEMSAVEETQQIKPMPGETPLQFAKRRRELLNKEA